MTLIVAPPLGRLVVDGNHELAGGLLACFPGNGQAYDATRRRAATVIGGLTYTKSAPPFGNVITPNWDGTDDDVSFGTIPFLADFSLLAWINVASGGTAGYRGAIRTGEVFGTNANFVFGWRLDSGPTYSLFCYARTSGTLKGNEFAGSLSAGWHRIGVSWTSGAQRYYLNGKLLGTGTSTNGADGGVALSFGGLSDSANGVRINKPTFDCRVYNRVLTDKQFATDYRNSSGIYLPRAKLFFVAPAGGDATITCTVGNASAAGTTAAINATISATVGNATAAGVTANVNATIQTATGNAVAAGVVANLNATIQTTTGDATAAGITATINEGGNVTITCTVGNGAAAGVNALLSSTVQCSVGNAGSAGVTALIQSGVIITASLANAVASGITALLHKTIQTSTGNAIAAGVGAAIIDSSVLAAQAAIDDGTFYLYRGEPRRYPTPRNAAKSWTKMLSKTTRQGGLS